MVEEQEDRPIYMCLFTSLAPVRSYGCDFFNFLAVLLLPGGFPLLAQAVVSQRALCGWVRACVSACVLACLRKTLIEKTAVVVLGC